MARIPKTSAVLGPCVAVALAVALASCSADDPAHRSFRPLVITASGVEYTGNGIAALDPQAIVTATIKATSSAPTVHLSGTLSDVPVPADTTSADATGSDGTDSDSGTDSASDSDSDDPNGDATDSAPATAPGTLQLDMVFTQFGAVGDITDGSVTSRLLRVEDEVWTAEPSSFWAAAGAVDDGKAYGGLYVKIPSADPRYDGFSNDTRIGFLLDRLLQTSSTWKKGAVSTIDGVSALELSGAGRDGHQASIWVATDGEPYILRIAPTGGGYQGEIDFDGYEQRLEVQAPLPGQVLDNALLVLPSLSPSASPSFAIPSNSATASPSATNARSTPPVVPSPSRSTVPSVSPSGGGSPSDSPSGGDSPSADATHGHGP